MLTIGLLFIFVLILSVTLNWRAMNRFDIALEAHAELKTVAGELQSLASAHMKGLKTETLGTYSLRMLEHINSINVSKHKLAILMNNEYDDIFNQAIELIYSHQLIFCNSEQEDKKNIELLSTEKNFERKVKTYKQDLDEKFSYIIKHPYKHYFCSLLRLKILPHPTSMTD